MAGTKPGHDEKQPNGVAAPVHRHYCPVWEMDMGRLMFGQASSKIGTMISGYWVNSGKRAEVLPRLEHGK